MRTILCGLLFEFVPARPSFLEAGFCLQGSCRAVLVLGGMPSLRFNALLLFFLTLLTCVTNSGAWPGTRTSQSTTVDFHRYLGFSMSDRGDLWLWDRLLTELRSRVASDPSGEAVCYPCDLRADGGAPVSYTHLTLPTICSV